MALLHFFDRGLRLGQLGLRGAEEGLRLEERQGRISAPPPAEAEAATQQPANKPPG